MRSGTAPPVRRPVTSHRDGRAVHGYRGCLSPLGSGHVRSCHGYRRAQRDP
ncbi:hypothetical protein Cus16_2771 [Curtobacterium sp. ER1/6]|nr:hypothetical protein Cus16_2771 [Curtobacterium sp. ER1/6]